MGFWDEVGLLGLPAGKRDKLRAPWALSQKTKNPTLKELGFWDDVGLLGLEPRLFWTKTRRVASYTISQCVIEGANLVQSFIFASIF